MVPLGRGVRDSVGSRGRVRIVGASWSRWVRRASEKVIRTKHKKQEVYEIPHNSVKRRVRG